MREHDHHAALLTTLIEEVRQNTIATISAALPKDAERPKFKPMPRPVSALQKAMQAVRHNRRMSVHDNLVRRLLGDRENKE